MTISTILNNFIKINTFSGLTQLSTGNLNTSPYYQVKKWKIYHSIFMMFLIILSTSGQLVCTEETFESTYEFIGHVYWKAGNCFGIILSILTGIIHRNTSREIFSRLSLSSSQVQTISKSNISNTGVFKHAIYHTIFFFLLCGVTHFNLCEFLELFEYIYYMMTCANFGVLLLSVAAVISKIEEAVDRDVLKICTENIKHAAWIRKCNGDSNCHPEVSFF